MSTDDVLMSTDGVLMSTDDVRARADLARARADLARARLCGLLGLQEAVHVHAGSGSTSMHLDACTQMHALRCMHSDACTQMHALRCVHSDACTQMHSVGRAHLWSKIGSTNMQSGTSSGTQSRVISTCGARSGPRTCSPGRASRRQMTGGILRAERRTRPER